MTESTRTARVITASRRAAAGVYADRGGPIIVDWLRERGYDVPPAVVVSDGDPVARALAEAISAGVDVVITTGGTGISPTDRTPEATRPALDYEIPGLADAIRAAGVPTVPTAVLSRGLAGVAGHTLVVNLPGSTGGVRDGLAVLAGVLDHAVDQIHGRDHGHDQHGRDQHGHDHHQEAPGDARLSVLEPIVAPPAQVLRALVTDRRLSVDEHAALVGDSAAGAVVTFAGVVRDHDHGRPVRELEYVGHPSAGDVIAEVANDFAKRATGVRALAVSHRIGPLAIGDVALAVAVSADHRRAAFEVCSDLVDEVKRRLPVWKRQTFTDGTDEWVNCP